MTEANFIDLDLQPPDTIRTPHIDVPEMVDFVIHLRGIRDTPSEQPDELPHHTMAHIYSWSFAKGKTPKLSGVAG